MQKKLLKATRDWVSKAKALREIDLTRDVNDNKKSFYRCVNDKSKTKENVVSLWKETGGLVYLASRSEGENWESWGCSAWRREGSKETL